jgi:hypothetical protein
MPKEISQVRLPKGESSALEQAENKFKPDYNKIICKITIVIGILAGIFSVRDTFICKDTSACIQFPIGGWNAYSVLLTMSAFSIAYIFMVALSFVDILTEGTRRQLYTASEVIYFVSIIMWITGGAILLTILGGLLTQLALFIYVGLFVLYVDILWSVSSPLLQNLKGLLGGICMWFKGFSAEDAGRIILFNIIAFVLPIATIVYLPSGNTWISAGGVVITAIFLAGVLKLYGLENDKAMKILLIYVFATAFGSFNQTSGTLGLFVIPFLTAYFVSIAEVYYSVTKPVKKR